MASGLFAYVGVGVESNAGNASSSVAICDFLPFTSENLTESRNDLVSAAMTGLVDVQNICTGPQNIGGSVTVEMQPVSIGYLLRSFFDATSTSVGSASASAWYSQAASLAGVRIHQFIGKATQFQSGSGSDVPTLTLHALRGPSTTADSAFAYYNMSCTDFEMVFDTGAFLTATFNFQGRAAGYAAGTTPSLPGHICWTWNSASISIAGAANATFQNLTIRGNNNLEFIRTLDGTINPSLFKRNGLRTFEISGNATFQNHTEYQRFKNGSEFPMVVTVEGPVITGSTRHAMRINLPRVKYTALSPTANGPTFISVPFQGQAFYSAASAHACEILLVNTRISDYMTNSNG